MCYSTLFREQLVIGLARLLTPELQPIVSVLMHGLLKNDDWNKAPQEAGTSYRDRNNKTDSCKFSAARAALKIEYRPPA